MFDDQPTNNNTPNNLPLGEPDDIFATSDKVAPDLPSATPEENLPPTRESALSSGVLRPVIPADQPVASPATARPTEEPRYIIPPTEANPAYDLKEPTATRTLVLIIVTAVVIALVGFFGWWAYGYFISPQGETENTPLELEPEVEINENTTPQIETVEESSPTEDVGGSIIDEQILFGQPIDKDADGLDDVRELELGTDPNNWDSDVDGLGDGDEILIWKTDPLNPDSDGDSYLDGEEVKNGYNPAGEGKIFSAPTS